MPLFSRARALDHCEHTRSASESDASAEPVDRESDRVLARMLREAFLSLRQHRFGSDEIAARTFRQKLRSADARDVEL